jgi:hypothetical protein
LKVVFFFPYKKKKNSGKNKKKKREDYKVIENNQVNPILMCMALFIVKYNPSFCFSNPHLIHPA